MEIRIFQIIVPLIALAFVMNSILRYSSSRITLRELLLSLFLWLSVATFSIIPDVISNFIASLFGIKSNINAVIFFSIGFLLYMQLRMYSVLKQQEKQLTQITRRLAIKEFEKEES